MPKMPKAALATPGILLSWLAQSLALVIRRPKGTCFKRRYGCSLIFAAY